MHNFLNKLFPKPEYLLEPPQKKRPLIADIGIFSLVFLIGDTIQTIVLIPVALFDMLKSYIEYIKAGNGYDVHKFVDYVKDVMSSDLIQITMLFLFIFFTGGIIITRVFIEKGNMKSLGFTKGHPFGNYFLGIAIGFEMMSVEIVICILSGVATFKGVTPFSGTTALYIALYFLGYVVQGMAEEVLFRGYLLTAITRKHSTTLAVFVSSLLFMFAHIFNPGITALALLDIFIFGVLLAVITLKTGNIFIACGIHTAWNFTLGNVYGSAVSGNVISTSILNFEFSAGEFGLEGNLGSVIVSFVTLIIFLIIKIPNMKYVYVPSKKELKERELALAEAQNNITIQEETNIDNSLIENEASYIDNVEEKIEILDNSENFDENTQEKSE